jgi:hypothetical protein
MGYLACFQNMHIKGSRKEQNMPYPQNVDPGVGLLYFNVKDYGATGDGITDDAGAIQDCINVSDEDSVIFFPPGTYIVGTTPQLSGKRSYLGTNNSTVKMADGADLVAVLASSDWITDETESGFPVRIANLVIDGNRDNNADGHGIVLMNYGSIIRECRIQNCADNGLMLSSVNQSGTGISNTCVEDRVESCKIVDCSGYGIYGRDLNGKLTDAYIESNTISGTGLDAIKSDRSTNFFVLKNDCYDCQSNGIALGDCFNTYAVHNTINGYGQDSGGSGYIAGISAVLIGSSIVAHNIISTSEPAVGYHYQHLSVTFGGLDPTTCLMTGNIIKGGWDDNPNNPSDPSFSLAIDVEANGTQTGSGEPAYLIASQNRYRNVGTDIFIGSYITNAPIEHIGDVQLDRHLIASNTILDEPSLAALSANGGSPPSPTFSSLGGSDVRGKVFFGSGTAPSAGDQISVTFEKAYGDPPAVVITPQNAATAALGLYVSGGVTTGFKIATQNAPTASQGGSTYLAAFTAIG